MAKIKYYITNDNGEEELVRTSDNEYHYYCYGKCSKTINNVDSEKKWALNRAYKNLEWLETQEAKERYKSRNEDIEEAKKYHRERIEKLNSVKIYELHTK